MILTLSTDDPPKEKKEKKEKDSIIVDTIAIQKEQMQLQMEQTSRMGMWDSLMLKQDTLIKKK